MDCDEPPVLLGEDKGANPVEYVLAALSGCLTTTLAYHAAAQGIDIEGIESTFEGDLDLWGEPDRGTGERPICLHARPVLLLVVDEPPGEFVDGIVRAGKGRALILQ